MKKHWLNRISLVLSLCAFLCVHSVYGENLADVAGNLNQNRQNTQKTKVIKGIVYDDLKEPLPGATVTVKNNEKIVTMTDMDGRFTLTVPENTAALTVSFVGLNTFILPVEKHEELYKVFMTVSDTQLEEVVVTGVITRKKESFTGSSVTFSSNQLKQIGSQNAIASLKTLDPSFNVLESSQFGSDPNRLPDIEIRGKSSLISMRDELSEDPNQPLFILDGFETTLQTIYNLDMNRILSITILKDASSTAIYGSKAANGVVVVETKPPQAGKLNLAYNGSINVSMADLSSYNLMNSAEKLQFEKLAGRYDNDGYMTAEEELKWRNNYNSKMIDVSRGVDTYWLAEPLRTGIDHRHSLYAEGGEGAFMFGIGGNYQGVDGVMKNSDREVIGGNIDLTYRLDKIQFMNKFYFENVSSQSPIVSFQDYVNANPYYEKYNDEGGIDKWLEYEKDMIEASNPLYNASLNSYDKNNQISFSDKFIVEYSPLKELKLRARFGITSADSKSERFYSPKDTRFEEYNILERGTYAFDLSKTNTYEGEFTLTYAKVFKDVHQINVAAGAYASQRNTVMQGYSVQGFPEGEFTLPSFSRGYPEGGAPTYYEDIYRSNSGYLIANYGYDNRYLFDFSYRVNGSSVFGSSKQYIGTWAVGLAWNIHREKFITDNIDGISMLKIRASIGNPGNQNFSSSNTITTFNYDFNSYNYFGMSTVLQKIGNPDLEWQSTLDRNIGMDMTIMHDKLNFVADYYVKTTDPLLIAIDMPLSSGATNGILYQNFGRQTSTGFSAQATYYIIRQMNKRYWWSVRATFKTETNELSGIGDRLESFNQNGKTNNSTKRFYDGADPDDIWAVRSAGIDPATGRELFYDKNGNLTYDYSYDNEVIIGNERPRYEGIVGTNFSYKGFSINADFRYKLGGYAFNNALFNKVENISKSSMIYNQDKRALYDRWQKPGDIASFKDIANLGSTPMSSRFVQKENTFSLESLRIGYEFDYDIASKLGLSSLRLNLYMNEVFRISTVKMERGTYYPFARSISFALSLTL